MENNTQNNVQTDDSMRTENVTYSRGNKIFSTIIVAFIIGAVAIGFFGDFIFPNGIQAIDMLIALGILFLLIGVGSILFSGEAGRKKANVIGGLVCLLIGGCMAGIPLYLRYSPNAGNVDVFKLVLGICAAAFLLAGVGELLFLYSMTLYRIPRCTLEIEAQVKGADIMWSDRDSGGGDSFGVEVSIGGQKPMKAYVFRFTYGGREYTVQDPMYLGGLETGFQIGDMVMLKINPEKPEEFYRFRPGAFVITGILAMGSLFAGVLILVLM